MKFSEEMARGKGDGRGPGPVPGAGAHALLLEATRRLRELDIPQSGRAPTNKGGKPYHKLRDILAPIRDVCLDLGLLLFLDCVELRADSFQQPTKEGPRPQCVAHVKLILHVCRADAPDDAFSRVEWHSWNMADWSATGAAINAGYRAMLIRQFMLAGGEDEPERGGWRGDPKRQSGKAADGQRGERSVGDEGRGAGDARRETDSVREWLRRNGEDPTHAAFSVRRTLERIARAHEAEGGGRPDGERAARALARMLGHYGMRYPDCIRDGSLTPARAERLWTDLGRFDLATGERVPSGGGAGSGSGSGGASGGGGGGGEGGGG